MMRDASRDRLDAYLKLSTLNKGRSPRNRPGIGNATEHRTA